MILARPRLAQVPFLLERVLSPSPVPAGQHSSCAFLFTQKNMFVRHRAAASLCVTHTHAPLSNVYKIWMNEWIKLWKKVNSKSSNKLLQNWSRARELFLQGKKKNISWTFDNASCVLALKGNKWSCAQAGCTKMTCVSKFLFRSFRTKPLSSCEQGWLEGYQKWTYERRMYKFKKKIKKIK
jgi:hypothetical protein